MPVYIPNETAEGIGHGVQAGTSLVNNIMHMRAQEMSDTAQMRRQAMQQEQHNNDMLLQGKWDAQRQTYVPLDAKQQQFLKDQNVQYRAMTTDVDRDGSGRYNTRARPGQMSPIHADVMAAQRGITRDVKNSGWTLNDAMQYLQTGSAGGVTPQDPAEATKYQLRAQQILNEQGMVTDQYGNRSYAAPPMTGDPAVDKQTQDAWNRVYQNMHLFNNGQQLQGMLQGSNSANNAAYLSNIFGYDRQKPLSNSMQTLPNKGDASKADYNNFMYNPFNPGYQAPRVK